MTYTQSELILSLNLSFGILVAKINYFKEMKVNTSLKSWQDGVKIQTNHIKWDK